MYMRKCKHCGQIDKVKAKHAKLCNECYVIFQEIRIIKIKNSRYNQEIKSNLLILKKLNKQKEENGRKNKIDN